MNKLEAKAVPLKYTKLKLRWVELSQKDAIYMAQLDVLKDKRALEYKLKALELLKIQCKLGERPLTAWMRAMGEENKVDIETVKKEVKKEMEADKSLTTFIIWMS